MLSDTWTQQNVSRPSSGKSPDFTGGAESQFSPDTLVIMAWKVMQKRCGGLVIVCGHLHSGLSTETTAAVS